MPVPVSVCICGTSTSILFEADWIVPECDSVCFCHQIIRCIEQSNKMNGILGIYMQFKIVAISADYSKHYYIIESKSMSHSLFVYIHFAMDRHAQFGSFKAFVERVKFDSFRVLFFSILRWQNQHFQCYMNIGHRINLK